MARPTLALQIAVVANTWTVIEGNMAFALGAMIGTDPKIALAILSKVQTATAKSQMIRAVGNATLNQTLQAELKQLLQSFDDLAKQRNTVIHGLWGIADAEPNGLLLLPADGPARISLGLTDAMKAGNAERLINEVLSEAEIWDASDFEQLNEDLEQLASRSTEFAARMQVVATARTHGIDIQAKLHGQLSS